ncbi:MAG: tetratricopeptide repeat protein [Pseudoalteromonas distincta]
MIAKSFVERMLDALLPGFLDVPCSEEGNASFLTEIGLLSPQTFPTSNERKTERGNQWPLDQPPDTNPLKILWDWDEVQEHYLKLRSMAVCGNNCALNDLGWLLLNTSNGAPHLASRLFWIAGERGCSEALYNLAVQYLNGRYLPADLTQALGFLERAAIHLPEAALELGMLYDFGHDNFPQFDPDPVQAAEWYSRGHEAGYCWATYHLSSLWLRLGTSTTQTDMALKSLEKLATQGGRIISQSACEALAAYYIEHIGIVPDAPRLHGHWYEQTQKLDEYWASKSLAEPPLNPAQGSSLKLITTST